MGLTPYTDATLDLSQNPKQQRVRRSAAGRRSYFGIYIPADSEGDNEAAAKQPELTTHKPDEYFDLIIGEHRLQGLKTKNSTDVRLTYKNGDWISLQQTSDDGEYAIVLGRELPADDSNDNKPKDVVADFIEDDAAFDQNVHQAPSWWRSNISSIMRALRECGVVCDNSLSQPTSEPIDTQAFAQAQQDVDNLTNQVRYWRSKAVGKTAADDVGNHPAFIAVEKERFALSERVHKLEDKLNGDHAGPCTSAGHAEWYEDWQYEKSEATKFYDKFQDAEDKYRAERAKARDFEARYNTERDKARRYLNDGNEKDEECKLLRLDLDQAEANLLKERADYKYCADKLRAYEPHFRNYTILRRDEHGPGRFDRETTRDTMRDRKTGDRDDDRPRRSERPERPDRRTTSPNVTPGRRRDDSPLRGTGHRDDRRDDRRDGRQPYRSPFTIEGPIGRATPALTTDTGATTGVRFKLNDIKIFTGDEAVDKIPYDKWRRMAIAKCDSIPEDNQVQYLESRIEGDAWDFIDDVKAISYLDLLEALDPFYGNSTYEKISDALSKLTDPKQPLKQRNDESFALWRGRFMAIHKLAKQSDHFMLGQARKLMKPSLAHAASAGFDDQQANALVKFLDAARIAENTQKQINAGKSQDARADKSNKPRTRAPGDRSPARRQAGGRYAERQATTARTEEQKDKLRKANACYRCGSKTHQARHKVEGCKVLPWDQIHLNAMNASVEDDAEPEDDYDDSFLDDGADVKPEGDSDEEDFQ
jgi:hypothetical protein